MAVVVGALSLTTALADTSSQTALKKPDRSKQCHCLQFAKCIASLLHYLKVLCYIYVLFSFITSMCCDVVGLYHSFFINFMVSM